MPTTENVFERNINNIEKIKLDLFNLKPKDSLESIYHFYNEQIQKFFEKDPAKKELFEKYSCSICGEEEYEVLFELDGFEYVQCNHCKSIYNSVMLKNEVLEEMYNSGIYLEYFKTLVAPAQKLRKETLERRKVSQISSLFDKPGKILDVGCGSGSLLKECQQVGWTVQGIDPSKDAIAVAKEKYGLDLIEGFFESHQFNEKFDCIVFIGLEHMQNPMECLKKAYECLNPGGAIFYEVPNADSFLMSHLRKYPKPVTRYIESARHYLFFSRNSIDYINNQLGAELEYIESNGLDFQTILLEEFSEKTTAQLIEMQDTLNDLLLGDHFRVFIRKK